MSQPSNQDSQSSSGDKRHSARGSLKTGIIVFAALALLLVGILSYFVLTRLDRVDQEVGRLSAQVEQNNAKLDTVSTKAASALDKASQAAQSALEAANERNQAEKAKAQFQQQAQQAEQQAQAAHQQAQEAKQEVAAAQKQAEQARQKAAEYRKAREEELNRLQHALGQIATTRKTAMGLVMTLGSKSIRFAFDKSTLRPEDKEVLSRIAGILSLLKGYQIYVYGYTDHIGTKEYNLQLSRRRAKSVYDYLAKNGVNPDIMSTKGFGEADPLVPGNTPQARAINRRVEIGIVDSTIKPLSSQNQ